MKLKFTDKITVIHEKFLALLNLLQGSDITSWLCNVHPWSTSFTPGLSDVKSFITMD